jgi:hypothetical protein
MRRVLLVASLLSAVAAAQGVEEWIDTALDPRTAPEQRVDALKKIAQAKEGLDKLAEKGLDARRDPEVVHAVVDTLLKASDYRPYVERTCRLLLAEKHRDKVWRRLQGVWESDRGQPLLDECIALARNSADPQMREAAILALGKIPRRRAVEAIVEAGLAATEEPVRAAALKYVDLWLGAATLKEALDLLEERKLDSFYDLVEQRIQGLTSEKAEHERAYARFLAKASVTEALDELEKGGAYRLFAAQRLAKLAEENGIQDKVEFARRVFDGVVAELAHDPPDAKVLHQLLTSLQFHARDPNGALWKSRKPEEVRDTIQRMAEVAGSGPELQQLGSVAVRLLGAIDDKGLALFAFAERFPSGEVRKEAIQQLGLLAHRLPERRNYVGIKLTGLLAAAEKEPAFRAQILNLLTQGHVPVVREPDEVLVVRGYLEKGATPELTDAELRDCALVLGKARTPEAKGALLKAASSHGKLQARRYVLEEALVPWARSDETIHLELTELALAPEQPLDARKAVIEALGKKGGRRSEATLKAIEESERLDPLLLDAVREAKLQLLKRLANGEGAAADAPDQKPADLEAAGRLLEQEIDGDADRLEALAALLVKAADAAKAPAGTARYRLAWLYGRLPAERMKEAELLRRYDDAAANAIADRLAPALREAMLLEYRDLLLKEPADEGRVEAAATCNEDLAEVALGERNKEKAARFYLDAAECHFGLGNRPRAKELLDKAVGTGGIAGELEVREQGLRTKLD